MSKNKEKIEKMTNEDMTTADMSEEKNMTDKDGKEPRVEENVDAEETLEEVNREEPEQKEEDDVNGKYMRLMADFQNYKRRAEQERSKIHAYANENIINSLLEVMDNFERSLSHQVDESFKDGMDMIFNQMKDVLKKSGVEEIKSEGVTFDPNFHSAVLMEETDKCESGMVSEVLQKGYSLNGKVIRPSMVRVAK